MTKEELLNSLSEISKYTRISFDGALLQAIDFTKTYAGSESSFHDKLLYFKIDYTDDQEGQAKLREILNSFKSYIENNLLRSISVEREIQIETVSDYLDQAGILLREKAVHPAAPAVIIGASLEEFLRNWLEEEGFNTLSIKMNLGAYSTELKSRELISKQDVKDITAWGGIRNDAAHGNWDMVEDRKKITLMLEGVNLFMRKYSS